MSLGRAFHLTLIWVVSVTVALIGVVATPAGAANAAGGYTIGATFGDNVGSQLPVSLLLDVPSDGSTLTRVTFSWNSPYAPWTGNSAGSFNGSYAVDASACAAAVPCRLSALVPTSSMLNGSDVVKVTVVGSNGYLGSISRTVVIDNPKPSLAVAWPTRAAEWAVSGPVDVSADPAPGSGGAPIREVRLYADANRSDAQPLAVASTSPFTLHLDPTTLGAPGSIHSFAVVAEDTAGNISAPRAQQVLIAPGAAAVPALGEGAVAASTLTSSSVPLTVTASVPDSVQLSTREPDEDGIVRSVPAGVQSMSFSIDGGESVEIPWRPYMSADAASTPPRTWTYTYSWVPSTSLTPGLHEMSVVVRTTYGATSVVHRGFVVTGGVTFGPVLDGASAVTDGDVVIVGRHTRLTSSATTVVPGTAVQDAGVSGTAFTLTALTKPPEAPGTSAIEADFAPSKPGRYDLWFWARTDLGGVFDSQHPDARREIKRNVVAEYQTRLSWGSSSVTRTHHRVITAAVTDAVGGRVLPGVTVFLQRLEPGNKWRTVLTHASAKNGRLSFTTSTQHARYRIVTNGVAAFATSAIGSTKSY